MKSLIVVVMVVAVAFVNAKPMSDEHKEAIRKMHDECETETGVDTDVAKKALGGDLSGGDEEKIGTYMLCVAKKMGVVGDDNKLDKEKIKSNLEAVVDDGDKIDAAIVKCAEEKATAVETAVHLGTCMYAELHDV